VQIGQCFYEVKVELITLRGGKVTVNVRAPRSLVLYPGDVARSGLLLCTRTRTSDLDQLT
jgi:sRNA-binding carbon storage regulator CsrA